MSKSESSPDVNAQRGLEIFLASSHCLGIASAATMHPWRLSSAANCQEKAQFPFIYWLIRLLRPARLVALGLSTGDTYSLFCQVVKESSLGTDCYAIDPCLDGGLLGSEGVEAIEDLWNEYSNYNRIYFSSFSSLIRADYNDALARFQPNCIDLIYLNSGRSYEHLRGQFAAWLPLLSPEAAVLVPAINRREIGWDAWSFWEALTKEFPERTLSFMHGQGTGILFPGSKPPQTALDLCVLDPEAEHCLHTLFSAFGQSVVNQAEISTLRQALLQRDRVISSLYQHVHEHEAQILEHHQESALLQSRLHSEIARLNHQLSEILYSRSWRLFAPARSILDRVRRKVSSLHPLLKPRLLQQGSLLVSETTNLIEPKDGSHIINPTVIAAEVATIRESGLFDESYYRMMYGDQLDGNDPIVHYCEAGWLAGNNPSDDFDTHYYLTTYDDIRKGGLNPFWHFVYAGASELRQALPDQKPRFEEDIWFGRVTSDIHLIAYITGSQWQQFRSDRLQFSSHFQQLIPCDELGFYDQAEADVLTNQAALASRHGIYGFCFELDWLQRATSKGVKSPEDDKDPLGVFLANSHIDIRFLVSVCLPHGSSECPPEMVDALVTTTSDNRYIRIDERPVILIDLHYDDGYAVQLLASLRARVLARGFENPYLIGRSAFVDTSTQRNDFAEFCDALLDDPAGNHAATGRFTPVKKNGIPTVPYRVVANDGVARAEAMSSATSPVFQAICMGLQRLRHSKPLAYSRFTLRDFRLWLDAAIDSTRLVHPADRRFLFMNSWNDWSEGSVMEPDRVGGYCRLNETTRALLSIPTSTRMPKVSVIVPNYNHSEFLPRRLESIYGQSYRNIEVILLDDCSSDSSRELMNTYARTYSNISRTIYNTRNSGSVFSQWALGIKAATGELIWIAESDDFCDLDFLERLVRTFDDEAVILAQGRCIFVDRDEMPLQADFAHHVSDLASSDKWNASYVETSHNEVLSGLGIKNTIPNASGVVFKRPESLTLLDDPAWLSMRVAGDWIFYLHIIRGGRVAYCHEARNYFRRYPQSTAALTYSKNVFYREVSFAARTVASLYCVPEDLLFRSRTSFKKLYDHCVGRSDSEFEEWYDFASILMARKCRLPTVLITTMGFFPGGAEIFPIRLANEFRRRGISVLLLSTGLNPREDGVRRMLRNDVPLVETSDIQTMKDLIQDFGIEVMNTHQWHIQKYPLQLEDVFRELRGHVASLHGMIEHGDAFGVTEKHLHIADQNVSTWVYTADKNLGPFVEHGIIDSSNARFIKLPNGMEPPAITKIERADLGIPEHAFVLCCVSRAIPDKGWAEAIRAVERSRALVDRDIRLILVGNGPVYEEMLRSEVPDYVYTVGFSENSVGYYAAADMGIMLTKFKSESFPLTIVDCLFAGKPYIATDVGEIKSMLTLEGVTAGLVIPLHDWEVPIEEAAQAIAAFASDSALYSDAVAPVVGLSHRYRIDVVADQYIKIFKEDFSRNVMHASSYPP